MLTFFPTPYPDELWYSVMCRCFVRSGGMYHIPATTEMLGKYKRPSDPIPGVDPYLVSQQLPQGIIDCKRILLENTIFPYATRLFTSEKREEVLTNLINGRHTEALHFISNKWVGPRYCPACYIEDSEKYGEPYWHREHQISLMPLCPKHKCRLIPYNIGARNFGTKLLPLSAVECGEVEYGGKRWETELSELLYGFLTLPYQTDAKRAYRNLKRTLYNSGYATTVQRKESNVVDASKALSACRDLYGDEIIEKYFQGMDQSKFLTMLTKSGSVLPDRIALLAVVAGLSAERTFGDEIPYTNIHIEKFKELCAKGMWRRGEIAAAMGMSPDQLTRLLKDHDMGSGWFNKPMDLKKISTNVPLTKAEKEVLKRYANSYTNGMLSVFVRKLLFYFLDDEQSMDKALKEIEWG